MRGADLGNLQQRVSWIMQKYMLSGGKPEAFLRGLTAFRKGFDNNKISEPDALKIFPYLFSGSSLTPFEHRKRDTRNNVAGLSDYSNAVQLFSRTYANDENQEVPDKRLVS